MPVIFDEQRKDFMNITTKLIFLLTATVGLVMLLTSFLFLRQREEGLANALRGELRAHAVTLQTALEENYADNRASESRKLIDRLRENTRIYAVLLFDEKGKLLTISQPNTEESFRQPPELAEVLQTGESVEFTRNVAGQKFISFILPVNLGGGKRGALEMVKPLDLIEAEIFNARINWLATTLFLLAVIFLVVVTVLRQSLTKPIQELLKGAEKIGGGNFDYRVRVPKAKDEIAVLAVNFNQMADKLAEQKRRAELESENRLNLEKNLRHSERLAAVGRLAAGVAHELGAPLNVIDARALQILENAEMPPEKQTKNLKIIRRQSERITNLVRQLLTLARPFNFNPQKLELNEHLRETIEELNLENDKIEIEISAEQNFKVNADADFLRQVWINILQNAHQAMLGKNDSGGKITINLKKKNREEKGFITVKFTDTGGGIAPEHLEKIFDPFYTTKDIGQGTGLGLAVAYRIIEEHGGTIEAANNETGGAVFTVFLPIEETK
jgi:signal transduction histidine kinase